MKRSSALILQVVIVLLGLATLALLLVEPHLEGRNAHATTFEIYFHDPFLAFVYLGSTPFFIALYRAFRLLGHVRREREYTHVTVDGLRAIKHCAIAIIGFVAIGVVWILALGDGEDRPAGIFMSLLVTLVAIAIAVTAAMFASKVENALRQTSGSDA